MQAERLKSSRATGTNPVHSVSQRRAKLLPRFGSPRLVGEDGIAYQARRLAGLIRGSAVSEIGEQCVLFTPELARHHRRRGLIRNRQRSPTCFPQLG